MWPKDYLVIADSDADPFVLDLSKSDENDATVLFAYNGNGEWSFEKYSETFEKFLSEKLKLLE